MTTWGRRNYEVPDGRLVQAEREIYKQYADRVSVDMKAKSLIKFGKSAPLLADTMATVWTVNNGDEVYVSSNTIDSISSSSLTDNQEIYIEGHTVTGTGFDQKFTFVSQVVTLNGQTRVVLPIPLARVSIAVNNNGSLISGRVVVYENTATLMGIPVDATKIHIDIPTGFQESFKAATTFSDSDYYILTGGFGGVSGKQAAAADFYLEIRKAGGVFVQSAATTGSSTGGNWNIELDPAVIIPRNADVRIVAEADLNNAIVFASFKGYLAEVVG
jgi:hypothetical protein